jgi:hypothetical protein
LLPGVLTSLADGQRYEPTQAVWSPMASGGAPAARNSIHRQSGWAARIANGRVLILGGYDDPLLSAATVQKSGAVYDTQLDGWSAVAGWPSGEDRVWAAAAWAGTEFVLWGGLNGAVPSATGERWRP